MALIYCRECGAKISDKALECPKCGATQNGNFEKQGLNKSVENVFISSETKTFEIENQTSKPKEQIGETPTSKKTNSRIKWILLGLLGIMMVILIGSIILLRYMTSIEYYKSSAEQGNADAQAILGYRYLIGSEVEQNYKEAIKWFKLSAEQGYARGQCDLGQCYFKGEGVEKNQEEAVKWFKLSAEQGYARAQYNLGVCYLNGEGVEKNQEEAVKWLKLSANQGEEKAIQALQKLNISSQKNILETIREERKQMIENSIGEILNTKWSFTTADGIKYILDIKGLGRNGKSAKAELLRNGNVQEYITIELYETYTSDGYVPMGYELHCDYFKIHYSPLKYGTLNYAIWDYSNGYLYENSGSFNAEAPDYRLSMKRIR